MAGERTTPLLPYDPRRLGSYELLGRLGEGGMGTVYLGRSAEGVEVAVKVVRADLAHGDEFRRRFRGEVARARQVPPFCTAEVLDADPDHAQPYLVVEYVDGPTLAHVVEERGPLSAANLHSVAIGVATALTAIHGAGVIHRDLKPRNVLLAPGSPKVIDFGIARAMEATSGTTMAGQMLGTVAYMAPERFADAGTPLTPAADVFAWGGVVAFAGTGRTPFAADSPPATAARILTQPPDLDGLHPGLRDLVASALSKDPADRPSARELLDLLVDGPSRPAATAAALADQPALKAAAQEAQAVEAQVREVIELASSDPVPVSPAAAFVPSGTASVAASDAASVAPSAVPSVSAGTTSVAASGSAGTASVVMTREAVLTRVGYQEDSIATQPIENPPEAPSPGPVPRRTRRWLVPLIAAVVLLAIAAGVLVLMIGRPGDAAAEVPAPSPAPTGQLLIDDALTRPGYWQTRTEKDGKSSCTFAGGMVARVDLPGLYKCPGPQDPEPTDVRADVGVRLLTPGSCAAIWFRFRPQQGYLVRVCESSVYVGTHKHSDVAVYRTFPLATPITVGAAQATRIGLRAVGDTLELTRDGASIGEAVLSDPEITGGRVYLGVFTDDNTSATGPFEVAFSDIKIYGLS